MSAKISACRICEQRFKATATAHDPRPVVWFTKTPKILIAGQAPGARVHKSGRPFTDPSGDRLRDWMGVDEDTFYDKTRIAIVPMAFCFPGYNDKGADLAPPAICAKTWRRPVLSEFGEVPLTLVIGGAAQKWHLGDNKPVYQRVADWNSYGSGIFPLPHPSWRNNSWLAKNPWFEEELLPVLRTQVNEVLL